MGPVNYWDKNKRTSKSNTTINTNETEESVKSIQLLIPRNPLEPRGAVESTESIGPLMKTTIRATRSSRTSGTIANTTLNTHHWLLPLVITYNLPGFTLHRIRQCEASITASPELPGLLNYTLCYTSATPPHPVLSRLSIGGDSPRPRWQTLRPTSDTFFHSEIFQPHCRSPTPRTTPTKHHPRNNPLLHHPSSTSPFPLHPAGLIPGRTC